MMPHLPIESLHPPYQLFQNKNSSCHLPHTSLFSYWIHPFPHIHNPPSSLSNKHSN